MNSLRINYNPLSFSTASAAWSNPDFAFPTRLLQSATSMLYDVYVKNPYDIIIQNTKNLFFSPAHLSLRQKTACLALSILGLFCTSVIYGTSIYLFGRASHQVGIKNNSLLIIKTAQKTQGFGKNLFLVGSVPLYGLFYALPKKIIQHTPHLIETLAKKTTQLINSFIKHVVSPLWNQIIYPIWKHAIRPVLNGVYDSLVYLVNKTKQVAIAIFKHVIKPLWNQVIRPVLNGVYDSLVYLMAKTKQVAIAIFKHVIKPLWNQVIRPVLNGVYDSLVYLVNKTKQVAIAIFKHVIKPLWNQVIRPVLNGVYDSLVYLMAKTKQVAVAIFKHVIKPLWNQVIRPILNIVIPVSRQGFAKLGKVFFSVVNKIASMAQLFFDRVITPVGLLIKEVASMILHSWQEFTRKKRNI